MVLFLYCGNEIVFCVLLVLGLFRVLKFEFDYEKGMREIKSLDLRKLCVGNNFLIFLYFLLIYILLYYYV